MFNLYGFSTQNTLKALYVLEELGADFEFHFVNLGTGEQRSEGFREKTPMGKVPVLEHDGEHLFESGAICRYVANVMDSPLYPSDKMQRARVDQWMDYFTCHLGHWFNKMYFELAIKSKFNLVNRMKRGSQRQTNSLLSSSALLMHYLQARTGWQMMRCLSLTCSRLLT